MRRNELADNFEVIRPAIGLEVTQVFDDGAETMPPATTLHALTEARAEWPQRDCIQPHQPHIAKCGSQLPRVLELGAGFGIHGITGIDQHAYRHPRLDLEHFQE